MSDVAALIADMVRAGVDPELVGRAAAALAQNVQIVQNVQDPVADKRRAYDRDRKAAKRLSLSTGIPPESADSTGTVSPKKETSPTPPKEKTTPSNPVPESAREFNEFWSLFPNKVGKRDAQREFGLALQRASFEAIMAGLRRYVAKTDDRPWCNPSTFLHQDRWADQPATAPRPHSTASPAPRNAGERAFLKLQAEQTHEPPDTAPRRMEAGDGRRQTESYGDVVAFASPRGFVA